MHILIVSYLPRGDRSVTKRLLQYTSHSLKRKYPKATYTIHELAHEQPIFYSEDFIQSQIHENFEHKEKHLGFSRTNQYQEDIRKADLIIVAHPIWNWSLPAPVKAWIDAIGWADQLFLTGASPEVLEKRKYAAGKKVLIINTSGMIYPPEHLFMQAGYIYLEHLFRTLGVEEAHTISFKGTDDRQNAPEVFDKRYEVILTQIDQSLQKF